MVWHPCARRGAVADFQPASRTPRLRGSSAPPPGAPTHNGEHNRCPGRAMNPVLKIPLRFNLHPMRRQRPGRLSRAKKRMRVPSQMLCQLRASAGDRATRETPACPEVWGQAGKGLSYDVILGMIPI